MVTKHVNSTKEVGPVWNGHIVNVAAQWLAAGRRRGGPPPEESVGFVPAERAQLDAP